MTAKQARAQLLVALRTLNSEQESRTTLSRGMSESPYRSRAERANMEDSWDDLQSARDAYSKARRAAIDAGVRSSTIREYASAYCPTLPYLESK